MDISVVPPSSSFPPSHISRLPSELLTNIFLRLAHACRHEARAMDCYSHQPYAWLPVTRVCRFWHDAALQCHSLWAFIDVSYDALEWLKVLLVRSGRVPLVAKLNDWDPPYEDQSDQVILELVLQELPRIVKLEVEITASLLTKLEALVQHPPPMLRSLSLRKICINGDDPLHEQGHFPLNFDLPHLRSLKVFRFKFSEAKTLFRPSLRKLVLDATEYPPLREVSECIRELPP
ncbi:unnamed protein product [Somion occarium]|uniref:F-box domain-containing protein n=1 Tax=Somion occarium TaxID=3059160 RepID=A0ABP1CVD9_9APHY